jgi:hypothetical protein
MDSRNGMQKAVISPKRRWSMSDNETKKRFTKEFEELYAQYRKLADKLRPFMLTTENQKEYQQLLELGKKLDAKHEELLAAYGIKRIKHF